MLHWAQLFGCVAIEVARLEKENGQIIEFRDSRLMCYHSHLKAGAGSVPCSATNSKSPNSFRAFSHLLYTPALVGLRRFASRALPLSFQRFGPLAASLFSVFL